MTDLVDIANGRPNSKISSIVIEAILNGVKVKCFEEGMYHRKFKNTANDNFYSMLVEYENKLISYGIKIVKCSQIEKDDDNIQKGSKLSEEEDICIDKKVITKLDIERINNNGYKKVNIMKNSLITPLAEEYIKTNHIELKKV
jgi:ethanolamine utilization protein